MPPGKGHIGILVRLPFYSTTLFEFQAVIFVALGINCLEDSRGVRAGLGQVEPSFLVHSNRSRLVFIGFVFLLLLGIPCPESGWLLQKVLEMLMGRSTVV